MEYHGKHRDLRCRQVYIVNVFFSCYTNVPSIQSLELVHDYKFTFEISLLHYFLIARTNNYQQNFLLILIGRDGCGEL